MNSLATGDFYFSCLAKLVACIFLCLGFFAVCCFCVPFADLFHNPLAQDPDYRLYVIYCLPSVQLLDRQCKDYFPLLTKH